MLRRDLHGCVHGDKANFSSSLFYLKFTSGFLLLSRSGFKFEAAADAGSNETSDRWMMPNTYLHMQKCIAAVHKKAQIIINVAIKQ